MAGSVREVLRRAAAALSGSVDAPDVDAEVLLGHVLGKTRAELFAGAELSGAQRHELDALLKRRCAGEPLQYLTGHQAFRRLDLLVGPGVLVPRPETEMVVEAALRRIDGVGDPVVVDVGTGSGAIALSIAAERPDAVVWATEISPAAAAWARRNLERARPTAPVTILEGDLLAPLPADLLGGVDLVVANPPYLSEAQLRAAAPDVRDHEPVVALVSGPTGLEVPDRVVDEAWAWLRPGGWLVLETWPGQAEDLVERLARRYEDAGAEADLTGSLRIAQGRRPGVAAGPLTNRPPVV